jgi:hypothetical protein
MLSAHPSPDIPLLIKSADSGSERRINASWSIAHLKTRLEPITGIPASTQKLSLRLGSRDAIAIEAADEENTQLSNFPLQAYAEIFVSRNILSSMPDISQHLLLTIPRRTNDGMPHVLHCMVTGYPCRTLVFPFCFFTLPHWPAPRPHLLLFLFLVVLPAYFLSHESFQAPSISSAAQLSTARCVAYVPLCCYKKWALRVA